MREMKDSGIEWIGEIPADWKTNRLQWHLEELKVQNSPVQCEDVLSLTIEAGVIPYEDKGNQGNKSKENLDEYKLAYPDTLVVNSMNVIIGAVGISKYFGCVSPVYYVFKAASGTDLKYIYYLFTNVGFQKEMRKYTKGILEIRLRISANDMLKLSIPSPSYEEQCLISATLDRICAKIDAVIAKTKATIEEYKKLKQSIITEAVTKGIRGDRSMKESGIEWIGEMPTEWSMTKLSGATLSMRNGYVGPTRDLFFEDGVRYIQSLHIKNGKIDFDRHPYYVSDEWAEVHPKIKTNDILIVQTGDIGQVGIVEDKYDGCNCHALIIATPNSDVVIPNYLKFYLMSFVGRELMLSFRTGALLPHLNAGKIKFTPVVVPSLHEQEEIAEYLAKKCAEIDALIDKKMVLLEELEEYKESVIYEYVTGKKEVV